MRNRLLILFAVSFSTIFVACKEYPCMKAELSFRLVGFSTAEADTIILRRLQLNSTQVLDSFVFAHAINYYQFGDTLIPAAYPSLILMQSGYDYQLFFPGAGRIIPVAAIHENQSSGSSKNGQCVNKITGCTVDGLPGKFFFFNGIYLEK